MQSNTSTAAAAATQGLTSREVEQATLHLQQTNNGVMGAIKGLTEAQWQFKAAPGCWSIAEIVEHIAFVQERVAGLLQNVLPSAHAGAADRNRELVDSIIVGQFPNRLAKFPAPEPSHPKGTLARPAAAERVSANSKTLTGFLESMPDLREHVIESAPLKAITKGEHLVMDGYQWILAACGHTERHTKQILEAKADAQFPEN